ncbi:MAG: type II toxin-antitoxin system VapC family toxin [Candidatus Poribacteria bacterium]|nr:type II toxin-antitoxin system VapC family toxin [Candidatus Poribacteria bacterium]
MVHYTVEKPKVYIETTVVSYLVARRSNDVMVFDRQRSTRQLWEEYSDAFEFVTSDIVLGEAMRGDPREAQRRITLLDDLRTLPLSLEAVALAHKLIDEGTVPLQFLPDAQHIAIAVVHSIEYLVSWNYKHIVNETKRQHIADVCLAAGYQPTTLCTPAVLIEVIHMKEQLEPQTDPILEECYRMKAEFAAQFNSIEELYDYLKAREKKRKAQGKVYIDPLPPPTERSK